MNLRDAQNFEGYILMEESVSELFSHCLPDEDTYELEYSLLFTKVLGYPQDGKAIFFDKKYLLEVKEDILYLFGQLKAAHDSSKKLYTFEDCIIDYRGKPWTLSEEVLFKLLYLGASPSIGAISPFVAPNHDVVPINIVPTYSLTDPKYLSFIKNYRKELVNKLENCDTTDV